MLPGSRSCVRRARPSCRPPTTSTTTTTPAATSTPQTSLGKAVDAAKKAAGAKTEATATATPATGTATTSAPDVKAEPAAAAAIPAEALAKYPKDVARALKARKVLVLGVLSEDAKPWRPLADDDRYVRNYLKHVNRYDGQVFVKPVGLDKLSTYGTLVNDLGVTQSPSVVVIDRNLKGTVLTGYVDRVAINQVIADARRDSISPNITDAYLRKANALCGHLETRSSAGRTRRSEVARPAVASYKRRAGDRLQLPPPGPAPRPAGEVARAQDGVAEGPQGRRGCPRRLRQGQQDRTRPRTSPRPALSATNDWAALQQQANKVGATSCAYQPHRPRLGGPWTASASPNTSPRPWGAASCFPEASTATPGARSAGT